MQSRSNFHLALSVDVHFISMMSASNAKTNSHEESATEIPGHNQTMAEHRDYRTSNIRTNPVASSRQSTMEAASSFSNMAVGLDDTKMKQNKSEYLSLPGRKRKHLHDNEDKFSLDSLGETISKQRLENMMQFETRKNRALINPMPNPHFPATSEENNKLCFQHSNTIAFVTSADCNNLTSHQSVSEVHITKPRENSYAHLILEDIAANPVFSKIEGTEQKQINENIPEQLSSEDETNQQHSVHNEDIPNEEDVLNLLVEYDIKHGGVISQSLLAFAQDLEMFAVNELCIGQSGG